MLVQANCELSGQTIQDAGLRHLPGLFLIETVRNGDIMLQAGDTLLLEAQKGFLFKFRNSRDFLLNSRLENSSNVRHNRAPRAIAIMVLMVMLIITGTMNILSAAVLAAGAMLLSGCLNMEDARASIDYKVLLV